MRLATRFFSAQSNIKSNVIIETPDEFKIPLNTDHFAIVTYEVLDDNVYDLLHSSIPEQFQGKGLGNILAFVKCKHSTESFSLSLLFLENF